MREATLHEALTPSSPRRFTLDLWPPPPPPKIYQWGLTDVDTFSGYCPAVLVWSAESQPITVALEANLCHVISFPDICRLTIMPLLWIKPHTMGWLSRYSIIPPCFCHPQASSGVLTSLLKINFKKVSDSISFTSSWCVHLWMQFGPWEQFAPKRGSSSCFLGVCVLSCVWFFAIPWTIAHQAPLSVGFSRQQYWSRLPFPPPGELPVPGMEPVSFNIFIGRQVLYHSVTWEAPLLRQPRSTFEKLERHPDHL